MPFSLLGQDKQQFTPEGIAIGVAAALTWIAIECHADRTEPSEHLTTNNGRPSPHVQVLAVLVFGPIAVQAGRLHSSDELGKGM